jgi:cyclic nucleotide gated channel
MFKDEMEVLRKYLEKRKADDKTKEYFMNYFDYLLSRQGGLTADRIFDFLPSGLVKEIKMSCLDQLKTIPFFKNEDDIFLELCIESFTYQTFSPGDLIFEKGVINRNVYLIRSGKIDILSNNKKSTIFSVIILVIIK